MSIPLSRQVYKYKYSGNLTTANATATVTSSSSPQERQDKPPCVRSITVPVAHPASISDTVDSSAATLSRSATTATAATAATDTTSFSGNTDFFGAFIIDSPSADVIVPDSALLRQLDDQPADSVSENDGNDDRYEYEHGHEAVYPHAQSQSAAVAPHHIQPLVDTEQGGPVTRGTLPLRVTKRKSKAKARARVAPIRPAHVRRRRGSTISLPRSPLSPRSLSSPLSPRSPYSPCFPSSMTRPLPQRYPSTRSTASASPRDPHSTISRLFLSKPAVSPSPTLGAGYPYTYPAQGSLLPPASVSLSTLSANTPRRLPRRPALYDQVEITMQNPSPSPKRGSDSSLHLGLGRFATYDPIVPGPSPPSTPRPPGLSPSEPASLVDAHSQARAQSQGVSPITPDASKPLPRQPLPSSPITPSRAPRKAAALLGVAHTVPSDKRFRSQAASSASSKSRLRSKPGNNFLPLPNSALTEIERFFGDVPLKPTKPSKTSRSSKVSPATSKLGEGTDTTQRKVGGGQSVPHKGEDGSMWLDIEEEQEFAWLMGDVVSLPAPLPLPLPKAAPLVEINGDGHGVEVEVLYEGEGSESEERWEMERFTSVLSLPKAPKATRVPRANGLKGNKEGVHGRRAKGSEESFLDLHSPRHQNNKNNDTKPNANAIPHPWSKAKAHGRSHSNPAPSPISSAIAAGARPADTKTEGPTESSSSFSSGSPLIQSQPLSSSSSPSASQIPAGARQPLGGRTISSPLSIPVPNAAVSDFDRGTHPQNSYSYPHSLSSSPSGSDGETIPSPVGAGKSRRQRPPPLTIARTLPNKRLPILTATTPTPAPSETTSAYRSKEKESQRQREKESVGVPETPFVRPRPAPAPKSTIATAAGGSKSSAAAAAYPFANPPPLPPVPARPDEPISISFFEPVTPVASRSRSRSRTRFSGQGRAETDGTGAGAGAKSKAWFKRVVKPLGGGVRV